jgi:4-amino-4-deoxy-L-arabinose transferase-like glycosyltransferase
MHLITNFLTASEGRAGRDLAVLIVVFGLLFTLFLGRLPLLEPDEARYAEIPREMLERGDLVTPRLNHVKYFEKPPLHYWLNAASQSLFGTGEFAVRFPSALLGLCGVLMTYHAGRRAFGRRAGLYGAMVLGSSALFASLARVNSIDMTLTFCMSAALFAFLLASREGEERKGLYYHLFYLSAALAVLAKGLIGMVLPGGVIFLYILLSRRWRLLAEMRLPTGIPLFLAVCAPWFVLVSLRNPEFAGFFFIHEHFQRFLTKVHGRYEPPWFFIPVLLGGMFPWTFFLPETVSTIRKAWSREKLFLLLWIGVILLFFSMSSSKLIPYILPVFPALALLVGTALCGAARGEGRWFRIQALASILFLCVAGAGVVIYPHLAPKARFAADAALVPGGILLAGGLLTLGAYLKKGRDYLAALLFLTACLTAIAVPPVIYARSIEKKSTRALAPIIRERFSGVPLVSYGYYRQDVPFYTGRRVIVAGFSGELEFGRLLEKEPGWFVDPLTFCRMWDSSSPLAVLMGRGDLPLFQSVVRTPARIVAAWGNTLLISNR